MFGGSAVNARASDNPKAGCVNAAVNRLSVKVVLRVTRKFVYRKHGS